MMIKEHNEQVDEFTQKYKETTPKFLRMVREMNFLSGETYVPLKLDT